MTEHDRPHVVVGVDGSDSVGSRGHGTLLAETYLSWLFCLGDRVMKVKKPVRTDFCDFSTREQRVVNCRAEVELNRRLAPDVYLGVLDLRVGGRPCEHAVLMRRLPDRLRLSRLLADGRPVRDELRRVAAVMAAFHARAHRSVVIDQAGTPELLRGLWAENLNELRGHSVVDHAMLDRVERRASAYLADRDALLRRRIADGHIVDGHGDLIAEDIFCLPDRPRILDCLEFDDRLRHGDVLADIGFLAMDLERLGAPDEAAALLDDYRTESGSDHPASLAHLYVAYRAVVSTKIACLRHRRTGDPADAEQARQLLAIADRHLALGRVRLVLVGGLPGGSPERSART
jgi:aminoglycoside phosphotransferase family enzyme